MKSQNAAIRPIHIKAKKSGDLGSDANGQLFLQIEHEEEIVGCMLCSSAGQPVAFPALTPSGLPTSNLHNQG